MALTLIEAAKRHTGDELRQAMIQVFALQSDLLGAIPFDDIQGNALRYDQEAALPGVGFRGVNEGFSESTGIINPQVEQLVIAGGDLDVDKFILKTMGMDQRSTQELMKLKALAHKISHTIIKGDSTANPKEFDGLQLRLTGAQVIDNGATSGGDVLSLAKLDEAIDAVDAPTHLLMTKAMRRTLTVAARTTTVGGFITYEKDEFGRQIVKYNDLPILIADGNGDVNQTLAFNEANPGGGSNVGTSIYVLGFGDGMLTGIQTEDPMVTDLGELETKPVFRTRIEWYASICPMHPRCAARLRGIKAGAAVA